MISYVWWSMQECHIIELLLSNFNVKNLYLWLVNGVCYEENLLCKFWLFKLQMLKNTKQVQTGPKPDWT